jgi:UDP-N-acetylmuramoyl-tripeptide--D-alanyl-D-alanine ligase
MLELGDETETGHVEAGEMVADTGADWFVALGEHASKMIRGAVDKGFPRRRAIRAKDYKEMGSKILEIMKPGDLVFLKASRRMGLERVAERIKKSA